MVAILARPQCVNTHDDYFEEQNIVPRITSTKTLYVKYVSLSDKSEMYMCITRVGLHAETGRLWN